MCTAMQRDWSHEEFHKALPLGVVCTEGSQAASSIAPLLLQQATVHVPVCVMCYGVPCAPAGALPEPPEFTPPLPVVVGVLHV